MLPHMRQLVAGTISPEQGYFRFKVMETCEGIFLGLKFFIQGIFWKRKFWHVCFLRCHDLSENLVLWALGIQDS